jgi:uncharacterized membrane protein YdfJ with MMPL/SSD domain
LTPLLYRLGRFCARHPVWVLVVWLAVALAIVGVARNVGQETNYNLSLPGTDSQAASNLLGDKFPDQADLDKLRNQQQKATQQEIAKQQAKAENKIQQQFQQAQEQAEQKIREQADLARQGPETGGHRQAGPTRDRQAEPGYRTTGPTGDRKAGQIHPAAGQTEGGPRG